MKLFVSDLDKTLMNDQHVISKANQAALHELMKQGVEVAIATGRSYDNMVDLCNQFELPVHLITSNGALVVHKDGTILNKQVLLYKDVEAILSYCDEHQMLYQLFTDHGRFTKRVDQLIKELIALGKNKFKEEDEILQRAQSFYDLLFQNPLADEFIIQKLQAGDIQLFKIEISCSDIILMDTLKQTFQKQVTITKSTIDNMEITSKGIHKAVGLKQLCDALAIPLVECTAIGDNYNDIEMLTAAGYSIAMGNAVDEIKEICDTITASCEDDGVAEVVQRLLINFHM